MCGIAGFHVLRPDRVDFNPDALAVRLLLGIEERGKDATGYVAFTGTGDVQLQKAACRAELFLRESRPLPRSVRTVLLHTRFATQGKPAFPENNHPVYAGGVYAVHNGHIWNDRELAFSSRFERLGLVDSEVIPMVVAEEGWDKAGKALEELDGDFAVALANVKHPGELILAKGPGSPLVVLKTDSLLVFASTWHALETAWAGAIGTPPKAKRADHLIAGDLLRIVGDTVTPERFLPCWDDSRWKANGWQSSAWKSSSSASSSFVSTQGELGDKLGEALDARSWGELDGDEAKELFAALIRCGCCSDYVSIHETEEHYGELVCFECADMLRPDDVPRQLALVRGSV